MHSSRHNLQILVGGISSLILTMGIARFTYTPALPRMQEALGLGDAAAGLLAAMNFAGYLSGALLASSLSNSRLRERLFRAGLILAVLCNALLPLSESMPVWSLLRYLSGLSSAAGMVLGTSLVLEHLTRQGAHQLIGVHFGGVGVGIVLTALALGGADSPLDWRLTWWASALLGLLFVLPAWRWVRSGGGEPHPQAGRHMAWRELGRPFLYLAGSYFFAGASFAVGTTFIIAVIQANPQLAGIGQSAWLLLGLAAAPSCYLWVRWAARAGNLPSLLTAYLIQTVGLLLPLLGSATATLAGGLCFGFTFMGLVAMVLSQAGHLAQHNPARLMGLLVTSYGVGQISGPIVAGQLMAQSGNPQIALWLAAGLSAAGTLLAIGTRERRSRLQPDCPQPGRA
ncbi:YbfB/YjiJ family MFS transporter [Sedimenticola hydrogenitrophicus]|uniref:YbfB/YjiJ family MFS transporter n=1 Tax=Sedimenticola hydrogenitrophicus TaxID=2967975 RepID=UPI0023AF4E3C|nr:YbfB/YjiJ family MFS transporter [Sedimenticola hydrogenitrophicus]